MVTCCKFNLKESGRQNILKLLLCLDGALALLGLLVVVSSALIKGWLQKYIDAVNEAEGVNIGGHQRSTFNYILSIGVISVLLHGASLKLWLDIRDWKKREKYKYAISFYQIFRAIYIFLFLSAVIACSVQEIAIKSAFELASAEVKASTKAITNTSVKHFTEFLGYICLGEVSRLLTTDA